MEYESDFFSFLPNHRFLNQYYQSQNSFLGSVGSLGKKNFMIRQGLKFRAELSERIDFGFIQFNESDFENQHSAVIFEFLFWPPSRKWAAVIFGEASYLKGQDDIGVALEKKNGKNRKRLFANFSEFSRNDRGIGSDRLQSTPLTVGFISENLYSEREFSRFNLSWQFQTKWDFPDESATYQSRQGQLQWLSRRETSPFIFSNRMVFFEELNQKEIGVSKTGRRVLRLSESREKNKIEAGLWYAHHYFSVNNSVTKYNYFQPFVWWSKLGPEAPSRWRFGLSAVTGDRDPDRSNSEYRFSIAWESKVAEVHFGFDLDRIAQSDMWEGGNVKVQASF